MAETPVGGISPMRQAWWRLRRNVLAMIGLVVVAAVALGVTAASLLTDHDPTSMRPWLGALAPGASHLDVLQENNFEVGREAETTAAIRRQPAVDFVVGSEREVTIDYRITCRRNGSVREISRDLQQLDELSLPAGIEGMRRIVDSMTKTTEPFGRGLDIEVDGPMPAGILPPGERVLLLRHRTVVPPLRYRVAMDAGTVTAIELNGEPVEDGKIALRGPDIRAADGPDGPVRTWHLLGTDNAGRDLYARIIYGGRISLLVGIVATAVSLVIGVIYGAISGYLGGRGDRLMMGAVDVLYGLPFMFLVILLLVNFGRNIFVLFAALGAVQWLTMARIVRGQVLSLRDQEYIQAARLSGCASLQIIGRHLVPNCVGPVIIYATLTIPLVILEESFLAFLGLQVEWEGVPLISWGGLVHDGIQVAGHDFTRSWLLWWPAGVMAVTLLALNALGSGLRDALDPKLQEGRA